MRKILKTCCITLMIIISFTTCAYAAQTKQINQLIEQAKSTDGQTVTVQGEAIGEAMRRGDNTWININDGTNAIGIWISSLDAVKITYYGNYKTRGDTVKITGVFHRACNEHNGEADIHNESLEIIEKGHPTVVNIPYYKIAAALILSAAALVLITLFRRKLRSADNG